MIPEAAELEASLVMEGLSPGAAGEAARRMLRAAAVGEAAVTGGTLTLDAETRHGIGPDSQAAPPGAGFFVPGRIEILGKHTDYAGGRSLLAAIEAGISAVVFADDEPRILVIDSDTGRRAEFGLDGTPAGPKSSGEGPGEPPSIPMAPGAQGDEAGWRRYPATYLRRIHSDLPALGGRMEGGAVVALSSSLPRAAGMSSSSALLIALHLALASRYRWADAPKHRALLGTREALAGYLSAVEAGRSFPAAGPRPLGGVGTEGGSQDHVAILCARAGHAVQYAFGPARLEGEVPLPDEWTFALAASGVEAPKAETMREAYNRLAAQTEAIMDLWRGSRDEAPEPHLGAIAGSRASDLVRLGRILKESRHLRFTPQELTRRAIQFIDECTVHVPEASSALLQGDTESFGRFASASHEAAREALGNDTPETEALTAIARDVGAVAASPFGAGFGGSVWALVREDESVEFLARWRDRYLDLFPERTSDAAFLRSRAGPPALRVF